MSRLRDQFLSKLSRLELVAFDYGADALKSVLLMIAVASRHIDVETVNSLYFYLVQKICKKEEA